MKLVFISGAAPRSVLDEYSQKYAKRKIRFVQQWWDYSMAVGLNEICKEDFSAISFPPVSGFPTSKCIYHKRNEISDKNGIKFVLPKMWNLPVIKQLSAVSSIKKELKKLHKQNPNEQMTILTHCIYIQSAIPAFWARKKYGAKVYTIVPDLPEHATSVVFNGHNWLKGLFKNYIKMTKKYNAMFDGYICFTEHQMKYLNQEKTHIVMEGFIDTTFIDSVKTEEMHPNRVVYAGGLMYRYGIRELVDGFIKASIPDSELYIYGQGEATEYVLDKQKFGVYYGGCVSREEAVCAEKSCFLLVNPRPTEDEYSKCSFPSKIMEYMGTGVPVITSKLACFPKEYDDKLVYFKEISVESIAETLKECFNCRDELNKMGKRAERFIREEKNVKHQANIIVQFIKSQE